MDSRARTRRRGRRARGTGRRGASPAAGGCRERGLMAGIAERLPRLLALVPYLLARPGVLIEEVAADFDVSVRQLRRDLELLWMCGLPGYGPGDLIDLSFEGDTVTVIFDAGMRRPLRLSGAEATALVVALRALAETPGVVRCPSVTTPPPAKWWEVAP